MPEDLAACHAMIQLERQVRQQLTEQLESATRQLARTEHRLEQLLRRLYGRSAEKLDPDQRVLFLDLLKELQPEEGTPPSEPPVPPSPQSAVSSGHGRRRIPKDLPRRRVLHDLPEEEKPCPCCGKMREVIGEETSEQLDYEPAKVSVIEHVRLKYVCRACEETAAEGGPQITVAEKPLSPIEKGLAAPGAARVPYRQQVLRSLAAAPAGAHPRAAPDRHRPLHDVRLDARIGRGAQAPLRSHGPPGAGIESPPHRRYAGGRYPCGKAHSLRR